MLNLKKEYYAFEELLDRWKISKDDLHYMIANVQIHPAIKTTELVNYIKIEKFSKAIPHPEDNSDNETYITVQRINEDGSVCDEDDTEDATPATMKIIKKPTHFSEFLYLVFPVLTSAKEYYFYQANRVQDAIKPWSNEFDNENSFHFFLNTYYQMLDVESHAVFMRDEVEDIENISKNAEITSLIERDAREGDANLNLVGALIEMMLEERPDGTGTRSGYKDEAAIKDGILARYPNTYGLKQRSLDSKFPKARKSIRKK